MSDADIERALQRLTRPDLATASFAYKPPASHFADMHGLRLIRLSRFWESQSAPGLREASEDFVAGMFGHDCRWLYALAGRDRQISCWIAVDRQSVDSASLASMVSASFCDARYMDEPLDGTVLPVSALRFGLVLTGCPDIGDPDEKSSRDRLEKLARSLSIGNWLYVVAATPIDAIEIDAQIRNLSQEIQEVRFKYLLREGALRETEHSALRYVKLLEKNLLRLEEATNSGLWSVRCSFYTDDPGLLPRARHALQSGFSGPGSTPVAVHVRPCIQGGAAEPAGEPLTTRELALLARPLAEDFPGYEVIEHSRFGVEGTIARTENSICIAEVVDRGQATGGYFTLSRDDMTRHTLVAGVTGSGKTNTCFGILDQVWDCGRGVPFLVIESAKSEYRSLLGVDDFKGMKVYTVGDETISPLRINPFEVPAGIPVQMHLDYIRSLFSAAFVLYPPMPYVLERAMQEVYEDRGWNIADNVNRRGAGSPLAFPTLNDLSAKVDAVVERMGYDQRLTMDVRAGLRARLDQLRFGGGKGRLLNTRDALDQDKLFGAPCLLELKNIVDDDEKAFIIGLILIRLYEYREAGWNGRSDLRHVTLIEEAHRLLRSAQAGTGSEISANPRGQAIEVFSNILSEIRALGEGIVISEQIPGKLATDIVKNTGTKILHRLVAEDDRLLVAGATNLDDAQTRYLGRLSIGEAIAWSNSSSKAVLVKVPRFDAVSRSFISETALRTLARAAPAVCRECGRSRRCSDLRVSENPALRSTFRRVYNAMRLAPERVQTACADFMARLARERPVPDGMCAFSALAHTDLDARGVFYDWPHDEVERLSEAIFLRAKPHLAPDPSTGIAAGPAASALVIETGAPAKPPFAGCALCASACRFRFDMAAADGEFGGKFRATIKDGDAPEQALAEPALDAASSAFLAADRSSFHGAAFCFAVQQCALAALKMSDYHQLMILAVIKRSLGRSPHDR